MMTFRKTAPAILSLVLIILLTGSFPLSAAGAPPENVLGYSLGQLLLGWNMLTLGAGAPGEILQGTDLGEVIEELKTASEELDFPPFIGARFQPLREKYEQAKTEFLWKFQPGYWGFNDPDGLEFFGAEIVSDVAESQTRKFRYLGFTSPDDRAVVRLTDKYLETPFESFTLQLWVRPEGEISGTLLSAGKWRIDLEGNTPKVVHEEGGTISAGGRKLLPDRWNHLALTSNGEVLHLYQNGREVGEEELDQSLPLTAEISFGGGFTGGIDELRVKGKEESRLSLNFDQPIDYFLVYPLAWVARENLGGERSWGFYASLLLSGMNLNREDKISSVSADKLGEIFGFLSGDVAGAPSPPADLPREVDEVLRTFANLSAKEELSDEDRNRVAQAMEELLSYLGFD